MSDPGYDVDLRLRSDVLTLTRVWMGDEDLGRALAAGRIVLTGPQALREAFPSWLRLSSFASVAPAGA